MNGSAFLYYEETDSGSLIPTAAMEVGEQAIPHTDWINEVILPPIDVASTVYDGKPTPDFVGPVYGELGRWAEEHDYQIQGHGRDYCIGPGAAPESWIMELQMPIRRP
jgi:effector-binding domain-containing protein